MVPLQHWLHKTFQSSQNGLGDSCSSGFRESVDSVLKASGYSDIDEAIGILGYVIKEVWWWIAGYVCVRSYCLHNNIYPIGRHFRVTSMEGIGSDMGVGRILHQSKFPQMEVLE